MRIQMISFIIYLLIATSINAQNFEGIVTMNMNNAKGSTTHTTVTTPDGELKTVTKDPNSNAKIILKIKGDKLRVDFEATHSSPDRGVFHLVKTPATKSLVGVMTLPNGETQVIRNLDMYMGMLKANQNFNPNLTEEELRAKGIVVTPTRGMKDISGYRSHLIRMAQASENKEMSMWVSQDLYNDINYALKSLENFPLFHIMMVTHQKAVLMEASYTEPGATAPTTLQTTVEKVAIKDAIFELPAQPTQSIDAEKTMDKAAKSRAIAEKYKKLIMEAQGDQAKIQQLAKQMQEELKALMGN